MTTERGGTGRPGPRVDDDTPNRPHDLSFAAYAAARRRFLSRLEATSEAGRRQASPAARSMPPPPEEIRG